MTHASDDQDRFTQLRDHIVARCGRAGFVAPVAWVEWFLRLELDAAARRTNVSVAQASRAMTLGEASSIADDLVDATRSPRTDPPSPRAGSTWN